MLKQSNYRLTTKRNDINFRGEYVDLGSYESLIYKHKKEKQLKIGYTLDNLKKIPKRINFYRRMFNNVKELTYNFKFNINDDNNTKLNEFQINFGKSKIILQKSNIDNITKIKKRFPFYDAQDIEIFKFNNINSLKNYIKTIPKDSHFFRESIIEENDLNIDNYFIIGNGLVPSTVVDLSSKQNVIGGYLRMVEEMHISFYSSIKYLGPLRVQPERHYVFERAGGSIGTKGERTPFIIYENIKLIKRKINKIFRQFDIPYLLDVNTLGDPETTGEIVSITLKDKRTNTLVTTTDVGFGISQVMPIIVEGIIEKNRVICIEQPEIHLHPKLQAQLADFFIEHSLISENINDNQWILETHSETLMLRIQKRIREGVIKASDVSVLYVNPLRGGSYVQELELDDSGDFIDEWPDGFFDESYQEMFGGS